MDPLPPTPPSGQPPTDPFASFDPTGSQAPDGNGKIIAIVVGAFVLVALLVGGILLFAMSGGDGDDGAASSGTSSASGVADEPRDGPVVEEEPEDEEPTGEPSGEPSDTAVDETAPPPTTAAPAPFDLFSDPTPFVEVFDAEVGPRASVLEAAIYPEYGFLTVRDPDDPNRVLEYSWVNQELDGPEPDEPFPDTNLDTDTYPFRRIPFDRIRLLVQRAPERVGIPDGHVTHILVDASFTPEPTMRIYVSSADDVESDYALATLDGTFTNR